MVPLGERSVYSSSGTARAARMRCLRVVKDGGMGTVAREEAMGLGGCGCKVRRGGWSDGGPG